MAVQAPWYFLPVGHISVEDSPVYGVEALQAVGTVPICTVLLVLLLHLFLHHSSKFCVRPTLHCHRVNHTGMQMAVLKPFSAIT